LRIVALADLHGHLPVVPPCDLLIVAGDLCAADDHDPDEQERWLCGTFAAWLTATPARHRVGVAGNHDLLAEQRPDLPAALPWAYLCDSGITVEGVSVWGSPWQTPWDDLAFNLPEPAISARWDQIPAGTSILVTHAPPYRLGDREGAIEIGSASLRRRVADVAPALHVFGHAHGGHGVYHLGASLLVNAAVTDGTYRPIHPPTLIDLVDGRAAVAPPVPA
jgi:hypothetical protein